MVIANNSKLECENYLAWAFLLLAYIIIVMVFNKLFLLHLYLNKLVAACITIDYNSSWARFADKKLLIASTMVASRIAVALAEYIAREAIILIEQLVWEVATIPLLIMLDKAKVRRFDYYFKVSDYIEDVS